MGRKSVLQYCAHARGDMQYQELSVRELHHSDSQQNMLKAPHYQIGMGILARTQDFIGDSEHRKYERKDTRSRVHWCFWMLSFFDGVHEQGQSRGVKRRLSAGPVLLRR